jgi:hypothetical protein
VHGDLLVTADAERADRVPGLAWRRGIAESVKKRSDRYGKR